jgi:twitching motility protein PilT
MGDLFELLRLTVSHGGSDLHVAAGMEPRIRRHGLLEPVHGWSVLSDASVEALLEPVVRPEQWREYRETGDLDFALGMDKVARFRVNFLRQQNGAAAVFRAIPEKILTLEELGLPKAVGALAELRSGLVLVTGPTGSGKSTTLAAILHRINASSARHIVTIEDPVEFLHRPIQSVFSQRELGADTDSFAGALRGAIRQDADVILVGEMRDLETIALALRAAEMGTLVLGTLHTNSAAKTIDRLIDVFPAEEQAQTRVSLADSLAAVVAQILLPLAGGDGRVAVNEILLRTPALAGIIREGNLPMLQSVIQGGKAMGMQTLDDALLALVEAGTVTVEDALAKANERGRFEALLKEREG